MTAAVAKPWKRNVQGKEYALGIAAPGDFELRIHREGRVNVHCTGDRSFKCGPSDENNFFFEVLICVDCTELDERGFMIDHLDINQYFQNTFSQVDVFPSCELIAAKAMRDLSRIMTKRGTKVNGMRIKIGALGGPANITAAWPKDRTF